jgi:hypothetical protein
MADTSLGLPKQQAKAPEQVQREEIVGRLLKPVPPEERVSRPVTTGPTCTIGCKVPMGLVLRLFDMVPSMEQAPGGARPIKKAQPRPQTVTLRGPGHLWKNPQLPRDEVEFLQPAGYALTHGVPLDFWREWYEQNKHDYLVENGLVFAAKDESDARAQSKDGREYKSGLEPIDPNNPSQIMSSEERSRFRIERGDRTPNAR